MAKYEPPAFDALQAAKEGSGAFRIKGVSSYDADLKQWLKTERDPHADSIALLREAVEDILKPVKKKSKPSGKRKTMKRADLLTVYPVSDFHVGMMAWAKHGSMDWNLEISEQVFSGAFEHVMPIAPKGSDCLLMTMGDFTHADDLSNATKKNKNPLDVELYHKSVTVARQMLIDAIERALEHHSNVHYIPIQGNHDEVTAWLLGQIIDAVFAKNNRVSVDTAPVPMFSYVHGRCLIAGTHGHRAKLSMLGEILAALLPEQWGQTIHRHVYTGHVHKDQSEERRGVTVESLGILPPADHYASSSMYMSAQNFKMDVWHAEYGRIARHMVDIRQLMPETA